MGYYIQVPENKRKASQIVELYDAEPLITVPKWSDVPSDKAVICVVDNGPFEAAGFVYDEKELQEFSTPSDPRPKQWLLMDRAKAEELTHFNAR